MSQLGHQGRFGLAVEPGDGVVLCDQGKSGRGHAVAVVGEIGYRSGVALQRPRQHQGELFFDVHAVVLAGEQLSHRPAMLPADLFDYYLDCATLGAGRRGIHPVNHQTNLEGEVAGPRRGFVSGPQDRGGHASVPAPRRDLCEPVRVGLPHTVRKTEWHGWTGKADTAGNLYLLVGQQPPEFEQSLLHAQTIVSLGRLCRHVQQCSYECGGVVRLEVFWLLTDADERDGEL